MRESRTNPRSALLMDFGGVLTTSVTRSFRAFCRERGLPSELVKEAFLEAYTADGDGPVHRMETGEITVDEFAEGLAAVLTERSGVAVAPEGLVAELFARLDLDEDMFAGVAGARRAGVKTALLSNSWGSDNYPRERFADTFDVLVISGEVGIRKPDPEIFRLAARRLGVAARDCVFVDDLDTNVAVAEDLGMAGIVHRDTHETLAQIAELLGLERAALARDACEQPQNRAT